MFLGLGLGLNTIRYGGGAGPVYDPDAEALFARFTTPPTDERKGIINTLIVALKTAGVWSKLDALYLMAAHDAQAARRNWVQDAYNLSAINGPTFTQDRGYAGNGSSSYLNTGFIPAAVGGEFTLDSAHYGVWSRTNDIQNGGSDIGSRVSTSAAQTMLFSRRNANVAVFRINQQVVADGTNDDSSGHIIVQRSDATTNQLFRNGEQVSSKTAGSQSLSSYEILISCFNSGGSPDSFSSRQYASATIGAALSPQELIDYHAAIETHLTAIGAA